MSSQFEVRPIQPTFVLKDLNTAQYLEQLRVQDLLSTFAYALRSLDNLNKILELVPLILSRVTETQAALVVLTQEGQVRVAEFCSQGESVAREVHRAALGLEHGAFSTDHENLTVRLQEHLSPTLQCFSTPILARNAIRGYLCVFLEAGDFSWTESREKLFRLMADLTALAIVAIEHESLRLEHRKVQDLLSALGYATRSLVNLNQLLELVPLTACRVTDARAGIIALFQDGRVRLEEFDSLPYVMDLDELRRTFEQCAAHGEALDSCLRANLRPQVQLFSTPILVKTTVRGYLWVLTEEPAYQWSEGHQKLLRLIADLIAVAIENEELTAELRRQEKLTREVDIGSEIQERLLPKTQPAIPGLLVAARCENALKVGGDYYDFIPILDTQRWGLVVGDVMGKGVPAGLIMMMTRSTLRSEVLRQGPPGEILSHLNRVMYPDLETSNRFVTLFYAEYEPSTRRLSYTNAAHPRPLFWRAKTREFFSLDLAGTLIGLTPDTVYTQDTLYLELGDVLVCYTDGFTEAAQRGGPQERFGEEKWTQQVHFACAQYETPAQILNYLYAQIHDFCDGPIDDDMTMIVLKAR